VVVIDAGSPRNAPAEGVHGLLARDGMPPAELLERGRAEVRGYGGEVVSGEVASVTRADGGFEVTLTGGATATARRLLVATGLVDELPDLPGLRELWGRDVIHCPYCHGWEARDRAIGVLAGGPMSLHQALLFRQLTDDVVVFANGTALGDEERTQLAARGIQVVAGPVAALEVKQDRLTGVKLADGTVIGRDVLAIAPRGSVPAGFLSAIGLPPVPHPAGLGEYIPSGLAGQTDVPGVWVAGNVTDPTAQVGSSAAAGALAGAHINADLVAEETREAVAARQAT
jgi:thioredoxin reductase